MVYSKIWDAPISVQKNIWANAWVKWVHHGESIFCCPKCLQLDGCYFLFTNAPPCPLHEKCHCSLEDIDYAIVQNYAKATSNYSKFDPYLFNTNSAYFHGKEKLFAQWGYTVENAKWLQAEMERQAREKYIAGEYTLGRLDLFGQRINITIEIPRKTGEGIVTFVSGWMVEAGGKLKLNTPYGGK